MSALWDVLGLPGPVLLANQDNDPVIQERTATLKEGDVPTLAQQHAFEKSAHGAIKAAQLLVLFSTTRTTRRDIMMSFAFGGGSMLEPHLHFLTHPTIASSHIVMQLQLYFYTRISSLNFWNTCA